jgi:hypothetical protein
MSIGHPFGRDGAGVAALSDCIRTIVSNAFSKSFGSSDAPTTFAISTKRSWRSASVSFGLGDGLFDMFVTPLSCWRIGSPIKHAVRSLGCSESEPFVIAPRHVPRVVIYNHNHVGASDGSACKGNKVFKTQCIGFVHSKPILLLYGRIGPLVVRKIATIKGRWLVFISYVAFQSSEVWVSEGDKSNIGNLERDGGGI